MEMLSPQLTKLPIEQIFFYQLKFSDFAWAKIKSFKKPIKTVHVWYKQTIESHFSYQAICFS